jgi:hypothetical protein
VSAPVTPEKKPVSCQRCTLQFVPVRKTARFCPACRRELQREYDAERYRSKMNATRPELGELEDRPPVGPDEHKHAKAALGCKGVRDLLALETGNDPFYCGTEAHHRLAAWYADLWQRAAFLGGNIRRIHYWYTSQPSPVRSDGITPYENTDNQSSELVNAARYARILGYVDAEDMDDRRNDPAIINCPPRHGTPVPYADWRDEDWPDDLHLPYIYIQAVRLNFPGVWAQGYDYRHADRGALVEVFIEKSTQNDILDPLCRELGINLSIGVGFTGIKRIIEILRRAQQLGRPVHIICVVDFDPGGENMPRSIARHAQYWAQKYGITQEVTVEVVALTRSRWSTTACRPSR